jgi:lipopolysaccharide export LptBFGC system permease protein LptF
MVHRLQPDASWELDRGPAESTFAELRHGAERALEMGLTDEATRLAYRYDFRVALSFAAVPLTLFGLVMGKRRRGLPIGLGLAYLVVAGLFYVLMATGNSLIDRGLAPLLVAWLPHAAVLLATLGMTRLRSSVTASAV